MTIDFADMLDDDDEAVIHPRDIFFTLDKDPSFSFPRDIQTEVMNLWFESRNSKDNVVKLNVGSGKTLVGLLLLQSSLNEGIGPALYVAPDKQLAQQVINEAEALGLDVTDNPRDAAYEAGEKICVVSLKQAFENKELNQEALKWLALVPLGIAGWTLNEARNVIFPDEKSVKILSKWPDYWKLKTHFYVGITFCALFVVPCLFIWFFDELKNFQSAWSFCTFTLALAINAGSFYFAKIELKSILARE